jgi:hypothetical protein
MPDPSEVQGAPQVVKVALSVYDFITLLTKALKQGDLGSGVSLRKLKSGSVEYRARAAKGKDVRDFYEQVVEFEYEIWPEAAAVQGAGVSKGGER